MTRGLHRFFVDFGAGRGAALDPGALGLGGDRVTLTGAQAHQISRVLRLKVGDRLVLLDGAGREFLVRLGEVRSSAVGGQIEAVLASRPEPAISITLFQALVPRDRFETVLQKGTEVGVARFVPTECERSIVPGGDRVDDKRLERWRRIVTEAAEQCERGTLPTVAAPMRFGEAVREAAAAGPTLLAWEREAVRSVRDGLSVALSGQPGPAGGPDRSERPDSKSHPPLALFVGPEGGFSEAEVELAVSLGALTVSLGPRILRTETAGPILAALTLYEAGDLDPCPADSGPAASQQP